MTETETYMSETVETIKNALEPTIEAVKPTIQAIKFEDYSEMVDGGFPEDRLIDSYSYQLSCISEKGQMKEYKTSLIESKRRLSIKKSAYSFILYGDKKGIMKDYWNLTLKPYLEQKGFKYVEEEKTETVFVKKNNKLESEEVQKIYLKNSLSVGMKKNTLMTIAFILENFELSEELKAEFNKLLDTSKEESVLNSKTITDNINLFKNGNEFVKELINNETLSNKGYLFKVQSSIDFLNWKLKQIKIFENSSKKLESDTKVLEIHTKIQDKLQNDKKFTSLHFIAEKYGL